MLLASQPLGSALTADPSLFPKYRTVAKTKIRVNSGLEGGEVVRKLDNFRYWEEEAVRSNKTMKNNECNFNLSLEQQLYWVNAINKHKEKDHAKDLLIELMAISSTFHLEVSKFLRSIINHSAENRGKICHLNVHKTGFQACTCFRYELTEEEINLELGFLVFVEEELTWYWSFSSEQMRRFLAVLEEDSLVGET